MFYEVIFFEDGHGFSPVKDFLDKLDQQAAHDKYAKQLLKKVVFYIEMLERSGSRSGLPYTKNIGNGLRELRPNKHRIFFFTWKENQIVLLHTFEKKTQKTPIREIQKAEKEMADWIKHGSKRLEGE